jgi:glycine cleavage system aminomethyltransferase T
MKPKYSLLLDEDGGIIDDRWRHARARTLVVVNGATSTATSR